MEEEKWGQPKWFWWSIGLFLFLEYCYLFVMVLMDTKPITLLMNSQPVSFIIFPLFFAIVLLFLPKKFRFDINTIFYLLVPFLLYLPNWSLISIYFNELFK
ncbi:hypothetical protein SAMN05216232_2621 [Virgibacillus subterraneus]|uniref:Uncharacterized protein n=2 Tax=Virgibacillus TaxID=84406 RepID=A0A1H1BYQ1_9BACI|nr:MULTISPECIES: hypothetical protein [Virgibacillus]SDQ57097.1 hypothetical protein SAMN05216231_1984 [Virgibacillus salinus]SEQ54100.1 hypothetical protein SAMN05216232_2621 [Virgibacillus subterraneus]